MSKLLNFSQFPPLYCFFHEHPLKIWFYSEPPKYSSFSPVTSSYLLKISKFLVKDSQFEFAVMTEKKNFVYKLFWTPGVSRKGPMKHGLFAHLSILPSIRPSRRFLGIISFFFFSKFWHDAKSPYEVERDRARYPRKNYFAPKNCKMDQKWPKTRFLNILKKFIISFYWKSYIICCVPAQIPYRKNSGSWDMGQNALSQSDFRIF